MSSIVRKGYGHGTEPASHDALLFCGETFNQTSFGCLDSLTAGFKKSLSFGCHFNLPNAAVRRMGETGDYSSFFEIADDDRDGWRGQQRQSRQIRIRASWISCKHGHHRELRRRHTKGGQSPLHRETVRIRRLPQEIPQMPVEPSLAFACFRNGSHQNALVQSVRIRISCSNSNTTPVAGGMPTRGG